MRKNLKMETIKGRVQKMLDYRNEFLKDIENVHIKIQKGNSKTGENCYTISLIPIADCKNCSECSKTCYDICNVCFQPVVQKDRAKNSALHMADPKRFWDEVDIQIKARFVREFRINVGGDLTDDDFAYVAELGKKNNKTMILFFTKNYKGINKFLENNSFPENVHPIMSAWVGMEMDNPNNLPCSHVLWEDGNTTAPKYGAVYCGGNCSQCAFEGNGCWNLKAGEHVIFNAH
jgi:hypothetical protein